jgi:phosphoribosylformimino-5-aminoimidazole carboxamide ribotide isomerase
MDVWPVLDLMDGRVVRGVAGRRSEYQPVVSRWTSSSSPVDVAAALGTAYSPGCLYVADLNAILGTGSALESLVELVAAGHNLCVDAGARTPDDVARLLAAGVSACVIGLETWRDPAALVDAVAAAGGPAAASRLVFSLDLFGGEPRRASDAWPRSPFEIVAAVRDAGITQWIVLDVAVVGTGQGPAALELCRALRRRWPETVLVTGGGLRGAMDLFQLMDAGVSAALAASALHDGRIRPEDVAAVRYPDRTLVPVNPLR